MQHKKIKECLNIHIRQVSLLLYKRCNKNENSKVIIVNVNYFAYTIDSKLKIV